MIFSGSNFEANSWCSEKSSLKIYKLDVGGSYSLSHDWELDDTASSVSDLSHSNSVTSGQPRYPNRSVSLQERNRRNSGHRIHEIEELNDCSSVASAETKQVNYSGFSPTVTHVVWYNHINYLLCAHCWVTVH